MVVRGRRRGVLGILVISLILLAVPAAHAQRPEWQRHYLKGLKLEREGTYRPAAEHFAVARELHPHAERGVDFGEAGRLDYDPYYHGARCVALAGGPLAVVRRLAKESGRQGVTPRSTLEALREEVTQQRGKGRPPGPTPFWLGSRPLRPRRPRPEGGARPPRQGQPVTAPGSRETPAATPTRTPAPRPALATIDLGDLPGDASVVVDGTRYPEGTREVRVRPGAHRLRIEENGGVALETSVRLRAGEVLRPVIPVQIVIPASTPPAVASPAPSPTPSPAPSPTPSPVPAATPAPAGKVAPRLLPLAAGLLLAVVLVLVVLLRRRRAPKAPMETSPTRRLTPPERSGGRRGTAPRTVMAGRTFGRYVVEERLGSGGMATTYLARRLADGREVALKVPHEHCLDDESFRRRFVREGRLGSQLHHPNIVRILEAGEEGASPYLAMELVRGTTLRELLRTAGELPLDTALDLARQVAEALDYAHSKGVIHRDLKPENLMILPEGRLVVMDFGIARVEGGPGLTATSVFVGTPAYAAPEAIAGEAVDHRMDLYALGILLLEMLEGGLPFAGASPLEQLQRHLEGELPKREELGRQIPDDVWELIQGLVARDPAARFPSAEAFLVALRDVLRRRELGEPPPGSRGTLSEK